MNSKSRVTYLDHAATSWPKPGRVGERMVEQLSGLCANAGRSAHQAALNSGRMVFKTREALAELFGVPDPADLVFTRGATEGINLVLKGFLEEGDRVLVSPLEHNAVMRPLERLKGDRNIKVEILPADPLGQIDTGAIAGQVGQAAPRLVAIAHGSNVNGVVQDLRAVRSAFPDSALLVDAAQTAGALPIDVSADGVDFMVCSAHKGLLGPTGVGVCYLNPCFEVRPLIEGGTGSRSEETSQPAFRPDRYEAGTLNLHGIAGLAGALDYLSENGLMGDLKRRLSKRLVDGLCGLPGIRLHSSDDGTALLVSVTLDGLSSDRVAAELEDAHGVLCRPGLQCAPLAHRHLGTFPEGTVRLSPGFGNSEEDVCKVVDALSVMGK